MLILLTRMAGMAASNHRPPDPKSNMLTTTPCLHMDGTVITMKLQIYDLCWRRSFNYYERELHISKFIETISFTLTVHDQLIFRKLGFLLLEGFLRASEIWRGLIII